MAYIYQHIRKDKNIPFYIGVGTKNDNYKRAYTKESRNKYWHNIIKQTDFDVIILEDNLEKNIAFEKEKEYINKYKRFIDGGTLCNICIGGNGGNLGDNINLKKSIKLKGHKLSEETKNKIRNKAIGRIISDATKKKMSDFHKLNKTGYWLKSKGHENGRAFKVEQIDYQGNIIKIWDCAVYAAKTLSINKSCISSVINGNQKSAGGFYWRKH